MLLMEQKKGNQRDWVWSNQVLSVELVRKNEALCLFFSFRPLGGVVVPVSVTGISISGVFQAAHLSTSVGWSLLQRLWTETRCFSLCFFPLSKITTSP